jgi:hypothetical protein
VPLVRVQVASTGETAYVSAEDAAAGYKSGAYKPVGQVLAETSTGEQYSVEAGQDLGLQGLEQAGAGDVAALAQQQADEALAGGIGGAVSSGLTGLADSATLGAYSALSSEEQRGDIARLRREQGGAYLTGRLVGDVGLGLASASRGAVGEAASLLPGGMVARASERLVAGGAAGSRVLGAVAGGALEGAAGAAADYLADQAIREKPGLSGEAFAEQVGIGALLGGGIGGALGGVGSVLERRGARRGTDQLGRLDVAVDEAVDTERAAMAAIDDLAGASDRVPLASLIPPRAASPEGVAERVGGVFGALRRADGERVALQREIDDTVMPGLDAIPTEQADALRGELGAALRAHREALDDARGWARGLGRADRERALAARRARMEAEIGELEVDAPAARTVADAPMAPRAGVADAPASDDLLAQLQRTQERVSGGAKLGEVSEQGAAAAPKKRRGRQPKMPDGFQAGPHIPDGTPRVKGIPETDQIDEGALYVVKASDLRARGNVGLKDGIDEGRKASIERGWADGKKFDPLDVTMYADGKVEISAGRHRLWAAAEQGRDIPVRFSRGIEQPKVGGKDAVAEWLAKHRRKDGVRYVDSLTGAPSRGVSPRAIDKVVTPTGEADEALPPPFRLDNFRRAEPGEAAAILANERARPPELDLLLRDLRREGYQEAEQEAVSAGAAQYGKLLDGDSDDAVEVFSRLDEAAEQLRAAVARARAVQPPTDPMAAVSLPEAPAGRAGMVGRVAGAVQNVGSALEVAEALGVPVPSAKSIPVIGPALSAYLKMRAAWRVLRGSGARVPATPAAKAASARVRIEQAARSSVTRVLELGEDALTSPLLPGLAGRQAGRLADQLRDREGEQREMREQIDAVMQADPAALQLEIARAGAGTPLPVTQSAQEAAARAVAYLQEVAPRPATAGTPWAGVPRYTAVQQAQWRQRLAAVQQPQDAATALAAGHTAPWAREALVRVWPEIWGLWREEIARQQDVLAQLARLQRLAIGRNFDLALDVSQLPGYPRAGNTPSTAMQPSSPATPTRAPQPSGKPRAASVYATPEQDQAIQ